MGIKCEEVIFNPVAPLYFILHGGTKTVKPQYKDGKIVSLAMPNDCFISIGDKMKIKGEPYKVNIINKVKDGKNIVYHIKTAERTKSSLFVLPMLSGKRNLFLYNSQLINAFIGYKELNNHIVLLYRWSSDPLFAKFEIALKKFPTYVKSFDADPQHTVFVFSVPDRHVENFKLFKNGKYSKLDDDYKLKILNFHNMGVESPLSKILFRDYERKLALEKKLGAEIPDDSELLSIITLKDEILDLNYYL